MATFDRPEDFQAAPVEPTKPAKDWWEPKADRPVSTPTTCIEHAYGSAYRLSFQIRVF
jgi:hypothetical protein